MPLLFLALVLIFAGLVMVLSGVRGVSMADYIGGLYGKN